MAKMRVYDLAKELGIESKQIIETLNTTEYAVKAASSNIDDPAQNIVRKKFGKSAAAENTAKAQNKENVSESKPAENKTAAPENKPAQKPQANEQNKPAEGAKTENAEQRPKKKSSITAVFNAQYSKQGGGRGGNNNRRSGNGDRRQGNGDRRPQGQNPNRGNAQARPTSGYDVRKAFERAINPEAAKAAEEAEHLAAAKAAELKAQREANQQRKSRRKRLKKYRYRLREKMSMHRIRSTVRRIMTAVRGIIMTDATVTIMVSAVRREMEETRETMVTDHSARTVTETEETMDSVHTRTMADRDRVRATEITTETMASVVEIMVAADLTVRSTASIKRQLQQHRRS